VNRTYRSAVVLVALVALTGASAAGCARDSLATNYTPGDGTDVTTDTIAVRGMLVVSDGVRSALVGTITNRAPEPDVLVGIASAQPIPTPQTPLAGSGGAVSFGGSSTPGLAVGAAAKPGTYVPLTLSFRNAGSVDLQALVVPEAYEYSGIVAKAFGETPTTPAPAPEAEAEAPEGEGAEAVGGEAAAGGEETAQ
jgi:copper(I)-binding protein